MTLEEIRDKLEELRVERLQIPIVSYGNYKSVLAEYQHIMNDQLVLNRNLVQSVIDLRALVQGIIDLHPLKAALLGELQPDLPDEIAP